MKGRKKRVVRNGKEKFHDAKRKNKNLKKKRNERENSVKREKEGL